MARRVVIEGSEQGVAEAFVEVAGLEGESEAVQPACQGWYDYTGLSSQEAHGSGWKAAIHPEDLLGLIEKWDALRGLIKPGQCEVRLWCSDGTFRRFLLRCQPLRDATGSVVRWYGTAVDTENRKQKETLRVAEKQTLAMIADDANLKDNLEPSLFLHRWPGLAFSDDGAVDGPGWDPPLARCRSTGSTRMDLRNKPSAGRSGRRSMWHCRVFESAFEY
jgi:hypothetical protein